MEGFEQLDVHLWNPFSIFGIDNHFLKLNADTLIDTWIVIGVLLLFIVVSRILLARNNSIIRYFLTEFISGFKDLTAQTMGSFVYKHFAFVTAIFLYIIFCNWISIIPGIEEPTKDLNTALALGFASFFYKEYYAIKVHGFKAYLSEFTHPFVLMFPLNVIGHFSKIISISFRLFGNIFGGSIISTIYLGAVSSSTIAEILGLVSGTNYIVMFFFIIFEGLIQAFVFAMLTLTYLSIAIQASEEGEPD